MRTYKLSIARLYYTDEKKKKNQPNRRPITTPEEYPKRTVWDGMGGNIWQRTMQVTVIITPPKVFIKKNQLNHLLINKNERQEFFYLW